MTFLQKEFKVTPDRAVEMWLLFLTWHDMESMPYPDEPEEEYGG